MSLTVGFSCFKLPPSGWRDESLMASDASVICITCTSLNTCIFSVLLFACISVSSAGSTGCVPVTVSNHMLLDKRVKSIILQMLCSVYIHAFYSPVECGQSSFYCVCCCM